MSGRLASTAGCELTYTISQSQYKQAPPTPKMGPLFDKNRYYAHLNWSHVIPELRGPLSLSPKDHKGRRTGSLELSRPPTVPLLSGLGVWNPKRLEPKAINYEHPLKGALVRALWRRLDGIWGVLKGSWGRCWDMISFRNFFEV